MWLKLLSCLEIRRLQIPIKDVLVHLSFLQLYKVCQHRKLKILKLRKKIDMFSHYFTHYLLLEVLTPGRVSKCKSVSGLGQDIKQFSHLDN